MTIIHHFVSLGASLLGDAGFRGKGKPMNE